MNPKSPSVLMVCLGNICRSPLAEGVLASRAKKRGLKVLVDSAGTADYHVGDPPDWRSIEVAKRNGIALDHLGRQFKQADFERFDIIFVMDSSNLENVLRLARTPEDRKKVRMLASLDPSSRFGKFVKDPYHDGIEAFHELYDHLVHCIDFFLDELKESS